MTPVTEKVPPSFHGAIILSDAPGQLDAGPESVGEQGVTEEPESARLAVHQHRVAGLQTRRRRRRRLGSRTVAGGGRDGGRYR